MYDERTRIRITELSIAAPLPLSIATRAVSPSGGLYKTGELDGNLAVLTNSSVSDKLLMTRKNNTTYCCCVY